MAQPVDAMDEREIPRQCPRCAYDLAGVIASWESRCPLAGTCSECGLTFKWRDIFDDQLSGPPWSFEHGPRWSTGRIANTLFRAAGLGPMWRGVRLEHPIVTRRLVAIPAVILLIFHLTVAVATTAATSMLALERWNAGLLLEVVPVIVWPYSVSNSWIDGDWLLICLAWVAMQWLSMPLLMLILGQTMRRVKVRRVHLLRGACYSAPAAGFGAVAAIAATLTFLFMLMMTQPLLAGAGDAVFFIVAILVLAAWLAIWWHKFIGGYLRLPQAGFITLVMMGTSLFATFTLMVAGVQCFR